MDELETLNDDKETITLNICDDSTLLPEYLTTELLKQAITYAGKYPQEEISGLILNTPTIHFKPLLNASRSPELESIPEATEYYKHLLNGEIIALVHSHPKGNSFNASRDDIKQANYSLRDWIIVQADKPQEVIFIGGRNKLAEALGINNKVIRIRLQE